MKGQSQYRLENENASVQVLLFYVLEYNVDKLFIENLGFQKCGRDLFISRPKLLTFRSNLMALRRKSVSRAITCLFRFYPSYNRYRARPE